MEILFAILTVAVILIGIYLFSTGQLPDVLGALFSAVTPSHSGIGDDMVGLLVAVILAYVLYRGAKASKACVVAHGRTGTLDATMKRLDDQRQEAEAYRVEHNNTNWLD